MQGTGARGFYEIPTELMEEIDLYNLEVGRFLRGEISEKAFKAFRVPRGIYSQRGGETCMMRIKLPAGGVTPVQMETVADLSERYGDGTPHVTDRQDLQIHGVRIEDTPVVLEALAQVNLTTWGGGGNTIRNITACAGAGVCPHETFDVSPYAVALTERWMMDSRSGVLPRKFKVAFSGCPHDCALATVNDLGFITRSREVEGRTERGFAVYAAGGMGAHSRVADCVEAFILGEDVFDVAEAVLRVFDRLGDRHNRNRARLRFVAEGLGPEEFRRVYKEHLGQVRKEKRAPLALRELPGGPRQPLVSPEFPRRVQGSEEEHDADYRAWGRTAVRPQHQAGYYCAGIRLSMGTLSARQLRRLAGIIHRFGEGTVRTAQRQNILLRWLRQEELYPLYQALQGIGLAASGAWGVSDVLVCPGASTCNLGICLSRGVAAEITRTLERDILSLEELQGIDIRVSGCPNACGQHPIGAIGLHGVARRAEGRMAPYYRVILGGRVEEGKTVLGRSAGLIPARRAPELIRSFLQHYLSKREEGETFHAFLERRGRQDMEELVRGREEIPPYDESPEFYLDWGAEEAFSLTGLGPGECSAGVRDLIEADIETAGRYLHRARRSFGEGKTGEPAADLYRALSLGTRALLVSRGVQPETDADAFQLFREQFVGADLVAARYLDLPEAAEKISAGDFSGEGAFDYVEVLIGRLRLLYNSTDPSLQFGKALAGKTEEKPEAGAADVEMDLRGIQCPFNYVQAKIRLETMSVGQSLRLLLDDGEPIRNVPRSLENDGQEIQDTRQCSGYYEVIVRKAV